MKGARGLTALLFASSLIAIGCNREEARQEGGSEAAVQPVEVTRVELGRSLDTDNTVSDATTTFRPGDTIYASVRTEGSAPSATLAARWTFEDGQVVDESSRSIIAPDGPAVTEFHISKPDGWPVGSYEVVISLDNREIERKSFRVMAGG